MLSGYLGDAEQADGDPRISLQRVKAANPKAIYVCDPVMGDDGKLYVSEAIVDGVQNEARPARRLAAPNAFELASWLAEIISTWKRPRAARAAAWQNRCWFPPFRTATGFGISSRTHAALGLRNAAPCRARPKGAGDFLVLCLWRG